MSLKKIMVASTALCILLLIYLIPSNGEEFKFKEKNVTYVQNNTKETIYLLDKNDYVARTSIATCNCDVRDKARELTEGLIIGGKKSDIIPSGFRSIIPPAVSILAVELVEGTLTIDFSRDLLDVNPKYEEKMIEAIVYTLTSLDGIDNVRILVEGEALNKLPKMDKALDVVLDKSMGINKVYDLTSPKDVISYTVYYVSKNSDYYYVPVTKYVNNVGSDKIKLIINSLATSFTYESNLMSFLNSDVELLDYKLDNDSISLNFNDMILDDIGKNNILEEVIYTICLSLEDNFDVKEVTFTANNEKISTISLKMLD